MYFDDDGVKNLLIETDTVRGISPSNPPLTAKALPGLDMKALHVSINCIKF